MSSFISFPGFSDFNAVLSPRSLTAGGNKRQSNAMMGGRVCEEILGSQGSGSWSFSLTLPCSDKPHLFSCAFWQTGMGINMMLKTLQYWTYCLALRNTFPFWKMDPSLRKSSKIFWRQMQRVPLILMMFRLPLLFNHLTCRLSLNNYTIIYLQNRRISKWNQPNFYNLISIDFASWKSEIFLLRSPYLGSE